MVSRSVDRLGRAADQGVQLALLLGGRGFAVHILWWIALIVLVVWVLGFLIRVVRAGREAAGTAGYRSAGAFPAVRWLDVTRAGVPGGRPLLSSPARSRHHVRVIGIPELPCAGPHPGQVRA